MNVVLLGNYPPDKQESMIRFAESLKDNLTKKGINVEIWNPKSVVAKFTKSTAFGLGKWLAYVDKWLFFPIIIVYKLFVKRYFFKNWLYHICDHSNSPYLKWLPKNKTIITCHDVLAIRGAFGFKDAYCPASSTGKILQKWILSNLKKAKFLTTVSEFTMLQLLDLSGKQPSEKPAYWQVIYNSFNADFYPMQEDVATLLLEKYDIRFGNPYLLHVGSGLQRKNRKMLVDIIAIDNFSFNVNICFAGEAIDDDLQQYIKQKNLSQKIISVKKPSHETLIALYSNCSAFVFPSFSEGFGWPLIEAQACGAPVIASNTMPMPEVSNGSAIHVDPNNVIGFCEALMQLEDKNFRCDIIEKGSENCKRFDNNLIVDQYIKLYALMGL